MSGAILCVRHPKAGLADPSVTRARASVGWGRPVARLEKPGCLPKISTPLALVQGIQTGNFTSSGFLVEHDSSDGYPNLDRRGRVLELIVPNDRKQLGVSLHRGTIGSVLVCRPEFFDHLTHLGETLRAAVVSRTRRVVVQPHAAQANSVQRRILDSEGGEIVPI